MVIKRSLFITSLLLLFPSVAHAYIDPVTGSVLFQAILGIFAAAAIFIKRVRIKLLSLFGIRPDQNDTKNDPKE